MTSRNATRRRRKCEQTSECVMVAWAQGEEDITEANKATHDALIRHLGDRRRGGITWLAYDRDEAQAVLEALLGASDNGEALAAYYRRVRALLREFGGFLVLATARAVQS